MALWPVELTMRLLALLLLFLALSGCSGTENVKITEPNGPISIIVIYAPPPVPTP